MIRIVGGRVEPPTTAAAADFVKAYFDDVPEMSFNETIATNAVGPYWLTFAFLPLLERWKEYKGGSRPFAPQVIMTSSMNGWTKVRTRIISILPQCLMSPLDRIPSPAVGRSRICIPNQP